MVRSVLPVLALALATPAAAVPDSCDLFGAFSLSEPLSDADALLEGGARSELLGQAVLNIDLNGDGHEDLVVGVPGDRSNGFLSGRVEVRYGPLTELGVQDVSTADAVFTAPSPRLRAGYSLANAGDLDGDGVDDLLIGSDAGSASAYPNGVVWLVYGDDHVGYLDLAAADATFEGEAPASGFGKTVQGVGDSDDDGQPDIAIGAPLANSGAGAVYVISGPQLGAIDAASTSDLIVDGPATSRLGTAIDAADVDGDGVPDLLLGAPRDNTRANKAGAVFVMSNTSGRVDAAMAATTTLYGEAYGRAGSSVASAGDLDGDGYDDLFIGSPLWGSSKRGLVEMVRGGPALFGVLDIHAVADARVKGENAYDKLGAAISAGHDLDRDGHLDVVIGATRADGPGLAQTGAAWVLTDVLSGESTVSADAGARYAQTASGLGGGDVAMFEDLNDDGIGDFVVAAHQANTTSGKRRGGVVGVFWGGLDLADETEWYTDADGDGWGDLVPEIACEQPVGTVERGGDCDETRDDVYPYAPESCDGIDYNCDGFVGEVDHDGDGIAACLGDCDDGDVDVRPGADELCGDDVDNNCDQAIDDASAVDAKIWAPDLDGDGDGHAALGTVACEDPGLYLAASVNSAGDCDETDPTINQFAIEVCDDIDNNCSGVVDEPESIDAAIWFADADNDGYGDPYGSARACVQPLGHVVNAGDCDDADDTVRPGEPERCNFIDDDCDTMFYQGGPRSLTDAHLTVRGGAAGEALGRTLVAMPDQDGDGRDEIVVGAPSHASLAPDAGAVYIQRGQAAIEQLDLEAIHQGGRTTWHARIRAERANGKFGESIATGDVNGDGIADLVVGAPGQARPAWGQGAVFYFEGPLEGDLTTADATAWFSGVGGGDDFGQEVALGDVDLDGFVDIVIGAPEEDGPGDRRGAVHILYGGGDPWLSGQVPSDAVWRGSVDRSGFGRSIGGGDFYNNGHVDLVVGAYLQPPLESGAVHVLLGTETRHLGEMVSDIELTGVGAGDRLGLSVAGLGDVDGDDIDDLLVGSAGNEAWLVPGGTWSSGPITERATTRIQGRSLQRLGNSVARVGDVNLDGHADMLISASDDDVAGTNAGAAVLIYGGPSLPALIDTTMLESRGRLDPGTTAPTHSFVHTGGVEGAVFRGTSTNEQAGRFVGGGGDVNGDGAPDILIGNARTEGGRGEVRAIFGGGYGHDVPDADGARWSRTLEVDGNAEDWGEQIRLDSTSEPDTYAVSWDEDYVYIGVSSGVVGAGGADHIFMMYFGDGDDVGGDAGRGFGLQRPWLPGHYDHYLTWRADGSYNSWDSWNGTGFDRQQGWFNTGAASLVEDNLNAVLEIAIPRAELGDPDTLDITALWMFDVAGAQISFNGLPSDAFVDSFDADLSSYLRFELNHTTQPGAYGSLPNGTGIPSVSKDYTDWLTDVDGDGRAAIDATLTSSCAMHAPYDPEAGRLVVTLDERMDDCDDGRADTYPDAPDLLGDGLDQNCDGYDGTPPVVTDCSISGPILTNDVVASSVSATDVDGELLTHSYLWSVDATAIAGVSGPDLNGMHFDKGSSIEVLCIATDGQGASHAIQSNAIIVDNTPPVATACALSPAAPGTTDDLLAVPTGSDDDGDALDWSYTWRVNGTVDPSATSSVYPSASTTLGDVLTVECTPTDGDDVGTSTTSAATSVINYAPTAPEVSIVVPAFEGMDLICGIDVPSTDVDGDAVTYSFSWTVDGVPFAGGTIDTNHPGDTVKGAEVMADQTWTCAATPDDGTDTGASGTSAPELIKTLPIDNTKVAAGQDFTCVILDSGDVRCWGRGNYGILGQGDTAYRGGTVADMQTLATVDLGVGRTARQITAGRYHVCAVLDDGALKCWGRNNQGQLGQGDLANRGDASGEMGDNLPEIDLGGVAVVQAVAAGDRTCVRLADGGVKCWGDGSSGALGHGLTSDLGNAPVTSGANVPYVDLGTERYALHLAAGYKHTCALLDNGDVKCWGEGTAGRTGLGSPADRGDQPNEMGDNLPAVDLGGGTVVDLTAGVAFSCALFDDGRIKCWGRALDGELGSGGTVSLGDNSGEMGAALPYVDLGVGRTAASFASGFYHACARLDGGTVKCWGRGSYGRLGYDDDANVGMAAGQMGDDLRDVALHHGRPTVEVFVGANHSCAVDSCSRVQCWGRNQLGQLGVGDLDDRGDGVFEMGDALPAVLFSDDRRVDIEVADTAACTEWEHSITVDGDLSDWLVDETFATSSAAGDFYVTWDADYLYLAAEHHDVAIGTGSEVLAIYLGDGSATPQDSPATYGVTLGTQTPAFAAWSQRGILWRADDSLDSLYTASTLLSNLRWTAAWDFSAGVNGADLVYDDTGHVVEMRLPRADLSYATPTLYVQALWVDEGAGTSFGAMPADAFVEGSLDPAMGSFLRLELDHPDGPAAGTVLGVVIP